MFDLGFQHPVPRMAYYLAYHLVVHSADNDVGDVSGVDLDLIVGPCDDQRVHVTLVDCDFLVAVHYILIDLSTPVMNQVLEIKPIQSAVR